MKTTHHPSIKDLIKRDKQIALDRKKKLQEARNKNQLSPRYEVRRAYSPTESQREKWGRHSYGNAKQANTTFTKDIKEDRKYYNQEDLVRDTNFEKFDSKKKLEELLRHDDRRIRAPYDVDTLERGSPIREGPFKVIESK